VTKITPVCLPQFRNGDAQRFNETAAWMVGWTSDFLQNGTIGALRQRQFFTKTRYREDENRSIASEYHLILTKSPWMSSGEGVCTFYKFITFCQIFTFNVETARNYN
jgi:hypothetical protein